jgi:drug/metabolite transporter (DMT)-like permease
MIYLLSGILFSALIPILLRLGKTIKANQAVVLTMNYVAATIVYLVLFVFNIDHIVFDENVILPSVLGVMTGVLYYGGFYFYQKAVHISGPSISSAFGKMGILIPMIASIILWKEIPTLIQVIGIFLALISIVIMTFNFDSLRHTKINSVLITFLLIGGFADFTSKLFEKYSHDEYMFVFLLCVFATALIVSSFETLKVSQYKLKDIGLGMLVGIPNLLTSYFLIMALTVLKATIVFPLFSGGTIVLTVVLSSLFFKEKLVSKEYFGIMLVVIAMILINI